MTANIGDIIGINIGSCAVRFILPTSNSLDVGNELLSKNCGWIIIERSIENKNNKLNIQIDMFIDA